MWLIRTERAVWRLRTERGLSGHSPRQDWRGGALKLQQCIQTGYGWNEAAGMAAAVGSDGEGGAAGTDSDTDGAGGRQPDKTEQRVRMERREQRVKTEG